MTDFLTRIAERTLGRALVARPIMAPLFAPGPAIPASVPASFDVDDMQDVPAPTQKVRPPIGRTMPQLAITEAEGATIVSGQLSPRTPGAPVQTQTSTPVSLQREAQIARVADTSSIPENRTPASPSGHALHETGINSNLVNEPLPPASMAGTPSNPGGEVKEVSATSARDIFASQQLVRTLVDTQAVTLKTHQQQMFTPPEEYDEKKQTVALATGVSSALSGGVHLEHTALTSEPGIAFPQALRQEGTSIKEVQSLSPEQHGASSHEASSKPVQRSLETTSFPKRGSSRLDHPGLLVPREPGRTKQPEQQHGVARQATGSTISYGQEAAFLGQQAINTLEQQIDRFSVQHSTGGTGPLAATPTIRVTIGRIDVRAVTPSEPATRPKPTRATPRISLEDYARQNKQGGR